MNIINTCADIPSVFDGSRFSLEKWKAYMDAHIPGAKELCLADMQECITAGYSWQNDFLPVLELAAAKPALCAEAVRSFEAVTEHLDEKIIKTFGRTVDADIILYLGLCSGAGWVTEVGGRTTVLLGLEKILELGWYGTDDMTGLIVHEAGHIYHSQYGFSGENFDAPDKFLRQLFSEGVAMVFEQKIAGDDDYFHQDKNGWKNWCRDHAELIRQSFYRDLGTMTQENQRYFGDWVRFEGHGDTGYYLGALFVRYLLQSDSFDNVIQYSPGKVKEEFEKFMCVPLRF